MQSADEQLQNVQSSKAAMQSVIAQMKVQMQEADAQVAKLDAELVAVDRTRFEFETECVRLREALRLGDAGGIGQQLYAEIERRRGAEHELARLDGYCRHLKDELAKVMSQPRPYSLTEPPPNDRRR
uniref:TATA element modulatory factor 1 TATA binding domain-containing protein n=2 Tax=Spongospora subterranea TaxID=70186 RepID=A0A0H5QHK0_9EUKA|eukprot:CRZ01505.1 hypothetical protein [Spongospora subterranea]